MAWTTPRSWVTGEVVTATLLDQQIKGNMDLSAPAIMTTAGDIIYASGANTPARLAKDTNATRVLTNTGTSNVPAWAQVTLTSGVTGTLPVGNGGTGATTLTDGGVLLGNGTGAMVAMSVLADSEMIVGDGTTDPVAESGATLRTSIGIGTGDSPQVTGIELGHASDSTITRGAAGLLEVEGVRLVTISATQTLTNKTLTTPTIASFANAGHDHADSAGGGSISGVPSQAVQSDIEGETNQDTYIPPDLIKHSPGVAKFWVKYAGDDATRNAYYNVGSVTDGGTGDHTVNVTTDFSGAHWCATMAARTAGTGSDIRVETMAAGSLRVLSGDGSSAADSTYECIAGFGDQ